MASRSKAIPPIFSAQLADELRAEVGRQRTNSVRLAQQMNSVNQTSVLRYLSGERAIPVDVLDQMCAALGLDTADLVRRVKHRQNPAHPAAVEVVA